MEAAGATCTGNAGTIDVNYRSWLDRSSATLQPGTDCQRGEVSPVGQLTIGFSITWALVAALSTGVAADDRIAFGRPGPPQTIAFHDAVASASVTFRVSHDARYDGGPAGVSPSISSGTLTLRVFGRSRRYDLSTILPIATDRMLLSKEPNCGTGTALSRSSSYLIVEAVLAEKGCAPLAAFISLRDGHVAREAIFDPAWAHRFDFRPYHASGAPIRIVRVERVVAERSPVSGGTSSTTVAWPFLIVHAMDTQGAALLFAVDPGNQSAYSESAVSLNAGDTAFEGTSDLGDLYVLVRFFRGELFIRPRGAAEARSDARHSPTPEYLEARIRRNHWFEEASERARRGDFIGTVDAFATMVSIHGGGDDTDASDAAMLATCRALERRVRAGAVSAASASGAFSDGCILQPIQHVPPTRNVSHERNSLREIISTSYGRRPGIVRMAILR